MKDIFLRILIPSGCQSHQISQDRCSRQMMSPFTCEAKEVFDQLVVPRLNNAKKIQHRTSNHCRGNDIYCQAVNSLRLVETHSPSQITSRCLQVIPKVIYLQTLSSFSIQRRGAVAKTTQIIVTHRSPACFQILHLKTSNSSWQVDPLAHDLVGQTSRPQISVEQKQACKGCCYDRGKLKDYMKELALYIFLGIFQ